MWCVLWSAEAPQCITRHGSIKHIEKNNYWYWTWTLHPMTNTRRDSAANDTLLVYSTAVHIGLYNDNHLCRNNRENIHGTVNMKISKPFLVWTSTAYLCINTFNLELILTYTVMMQKQENNKIILVFYSWYFREKNKPTAFACANFLEWRITAVIFYC